MAVFEEFAARFAARQPRAVAADEIKRAEAELGCPLSPQHREFLRTIGSLRSPALLELVVAKESVLPALEGISAPEDLVDKTLRYRAAGMPSSLILVGLDASGNAICVRMGSEQVVVFDHESRRLAEVAKSLKALMSGYLALGESQ